MKKLLTLVKYLLMLPFYWLSCMIPKDKNLWVFGSGGGQDFIDNSKYLFLFLHQKKYNKKTKMIWLSKNLQIIKFLQKSGYEAYHYYSLRGIWYILRAKYAFMSHKIDDINKYFSGGTKLIQLWHGIPLKKIGYNGDWNDRDFKGKLKKIYFKLIPYSYYLLCDKVLVPSVSEDIIKIFKEAFKYSFKTDKNDNFLIFPYPRWLSFSENFRFYDSIFPEIYSLNKFKKRYKYILVWLSTHRMQLRKNFKDIIQEINLDFEYLDEFCKNNSILFFIKPHFTDIHSAEKLTFRYENIQIYKYTDPYPLLKYTDILITDYSSIYFDFLILNRPLIFFPFDLEEYKEKVGFYFNYDEITPGYKVYNIEQLIESLQEIIQGKDRFNNDRKKVMNNILGIKNRKDIYTFFENIDKVLIK